MQVQVMHLAVVTPSEYRVGEYTFFSTHCGMQHYKEMLRLKKVQQCNESYKSIRKALT